MKSPIEDLFHQYHPSLVKYLKRFLGPRKSEAEDICQIAWIRAWHHLANIRREDRFFPYIKKIAVHLALNQLEKKRPQYGLDLLPEEFFRDSSHEERRQEQEVSEELALALSLLPDKERKVLDLRYFESREVKEIAHELAVSQQSVRSWIKQGRRRLAGILKHRQEGVMAVR